VTDLDFYKEPLFFFVSLISENEVTLSKWPKIPEVNPEDSHFKSYIVHDEEGFFIEDPWNSVEDSDMTL